MKKRIQIAVILAAMICMSISGCSESTVIPKSTSQITEMYYVKRDNSRLVGITDSFEI